MGSCVWGNRDDILLDLDTSHFEHCKARCACPHALYAAAVLHQLLVTISHSHWPEILLLSIFIRKIQSFLSSLPPCYDIDWCLQHADQLDLKLFAKHFDIRNKSDANRRYSDILSSKFQESVPRAKRYLQTSRTGKEAALKKTFGPQWIVVIKRSYVVCVCKLTG